MCLVFCKTTVLVKVPLENSHWCFWFVNFNFMLLPNLSSTALVMSGFHNGWSQRYSVHDNLQPYLCREVWNSFKSGDKARSTASQQAQGRLLPAELLMLVLILAVAVIIARWPLSPIPTCGCLQEFVDLCECLLPRSWDYDAWENLISQHRKRGKAAWWLGGEARSQKHSSK